MHDLLCLVHFHSPLGTSNETFEEYYQNICRKVLISFHNHQDLKFCLHISGIFLEWLDDKHPEILMLINDMVKRQQVEIIGGPFYEAALSMIPNSDKVGQIELLTTYLRKKFGKRPRGGLVPHLIWEPSLASSLKTSGFDYTFVNSSHVEAVDKGMEFTPSITEDQGKSIVLFPVSQKISRMIGRMRPVDMVRSLEAGAGRVYTIFIDTGQLLEDQEIFRDEGWFDEFLDKLAESEHFISSRLPRSVLRKRTAYTRVYLPCTPPFSYAENGKVHEDFFRQKLSQNPLANNLYGKMIYTYQLVNQIKGDRSRKKTARTEMWKGQCNEAYWDERYLDTHQYRKSLYASFMEAEKITREKGIFKPSISATDVNMDGSLEYLYQSQNLNCYVLPRSGSIFEIDYLPSLWNYGDTYPLQERPQSISTSFIDMCYSEMPKKIADAAENREYIEYKVDDFDRDQKLLHFNASSKLHIKRNTVVPFKLHKTYQFKKNTIALSYIPKIPGNAGNYRELILGTQLALSFVNSSGYSIKKSRKEGVTDIDILDTVNNVHIAVSINTECTVFYDDIYSSGKERRYQFTRIFILTTVRDREELLYTLKLEKK